VIQFWINIPGRYITWEMGGGSQFTMTLCTGLSQTPENQNGGRPHPCRMEAGAGSDEPTMTEHGIYVPGHPFAIFIQVSNRGRNGCIKSWFCQYISIPMKYTVNGSTLQCKVIGGGIRDRSLEFLDMEKFTSILCLLLFVCSLTAFLGVI
jgi:hypothetical protein